MRSYGTLARYYDELTLDVPYAAFADYYERLFHERGEAPHTILDLACGTGTLTLLLARRGYELISVDGSPEMLSMAMEKLCDEALPVRPLLLCQGMAELDLYGTVDAAICSLDGMNYLPPAALPEVFRRLRLFIRPGGLLIFDVNTPERLRSLDGQVFVDEREDVLALWRAEYDGGRDCLRYGMDLFEASDGGLWRREQEEHVEYAHSSELLRGLLGRAGFLDTDIRRDGPQSGEGREFVITRRQDS